MKNINTLLALLQCPQCQGEKLSIEDTSLELLCNACAKRYPLNHNRPVLLHPDNKIFCEDDYRQAALPPLKIKARGFQRFIPSPSINLASNGVLARVRNLLEDKSSVTVLVVGGGRQRSLLDVTLGASKAVRLVYSVIDVGADVDLFCDGHDLPFIDGIFYAVITTAVLEHVLDPKRVATEIYRVLKVGGLLYSELPFMQQVHDGAYDFTRYTLSGHRRLFNNFEELESGMVAGPATAVVWAIENFVLAFFSKSVLRKLSKVLVRVGFFWLKYLDLILAHRPDAMDGASCTYLLGRKIEGHVSDAEIISRYVGAKHLRHI